MTEHTGRSSRYWAMSLRPAAGASTNKMHPGCCEGVRHHQCCGPPVCNACAMPPNSCTVPYGCRPTAAGYHMPCMHAFCGCKQLAAAGAPTSHGHVYCGEALAASAHKRAHKHIAICAMHCAYTMPLVSVPCSFIGTAIRICESAYAWAGTITEICSSRVCAQRTCSWGAACCYCCCCHNAIGLHANFCPCLGHSACQRPSRPHTLHHYCTVLGRDHDARL
jgi:hypothetical protein